ncbi:MAG: FHA domain-containing protein [Polyangiaceae bacterium]
MRPRIRFQHQELDLPLGATLIGRDPDCHVTLDDPLVSRKHARILVGADRVVVEDLGSRNGVLVNGLCIRRPASLRDGDRLHIGTQAFLYCEVDEVPPSMPSRPTAELGLCAGCRLPYPVKAPACPMCGSHERFQPNQGPWVDPSVDRPSGIQARVTPPHGAPAATSPPDPPRPPADTVEEIPLEKLLGRRERT